MSAELNLHDPEATDELGARLGRGIRSLEAANACWIGLSGTLGAGKTALARAALRELGETGPVRSPTFTLLETYHLCGRDILHLDLYRLADPEELEFLGLRDWFEGNAVILIEWPEKAAGVLPPVDLALKLEQAGSGRRVKVDSGSRAGDTLLAACVNTT